jgi:hypothetical protein
MHGKREHVLEEPQGLDLRPIERQRQDQEVEPPGDQVVEQVLGLGLAQRQLEIRIGPVQLRQDPRQKIWPDRGDHAEPQQTAQDARAPTGELGQILDRQQDLPAALGHLLAGAGQPQAGRGALDQRDAERGLEFAHLHAQSQLGDPAALRRTAEMAGFGQSREVGQLPQSGRHPIIFPYQPGKKIRLDLMAGKRQFMDAERPSKEVGTWRGVSLRSSRSPAAARSTRTSQPISDLDSSSADRPGGLCLPGPLGRCLACGEAILQVSGGPAS